VFLGVFAFSLFSLAQHIHDYNSKSERTPYVFKSVGDRTFTFAGRPVSLVDEDKEGQSVVVLRYGEKELRLVASIAPQDARLPGLVRHSDWLRVLRFAEFKGDSKEAFKEHLDQGNDRLVVLTRRPLTAPDPRTGDVWRRDWVFDFHELLPSGEIQTRALRYPKTKGDKDPRPDELRNNTWEMDAAMTLMPQNPPDSLNFGRPTTAFKDDALRTAGWTMPAAVISVLGLVACLAVLFSPRGRARPKGG
jgi:hypothetical protein